MYGEPIKQNNVSKLFVNNKNDKRYTDSVSYNNAVSDDTFNQAYLSNKDNAINLGYKSDFNRPQYIMRRDAVGGLKADRGAATWTNDVNDKSLKGNNNAINALNNLGVKPEGYKDYVFMSTEAPEKQKQVQLMNSEFDKNAYDRPLYDKLRDSGTKRIIVKDTNYGGHSNSRKTYTLGSTTYNPFEAQDKSLVNDKMSGVQNMSREEYVALMDENKRYQNYLRMANVRPNADVRFNIPREQRTFNYR